MHKRTYRAAFEDEPKLRLKLADAAPGPDEPGIRLSRLENSRHFGIRISSMNASTRAWSAQFGCGAADQATWWSTHVTVTAESAVSAAAILAAAYLPLAAAAQLEADKQVVCLFSLVARALPAGDEWDLSGLLLDGKPVSRATVVAWLNAAYQAAYEEEFEEQQRDKNPACSGEGLYQLLSFADAVDSTRPVLRACCSRLQSLQLHAQLGQQQVALDTDGTGYYFSTRSQRLVYQPDLTAAGLDIDAAPAAPSAEERKAFKQQVAAQTEQLLWLAYRLQLQPLVQHLHNFIQALSHFAQSLLRNKCEAVFTSRVLEAAGVASLPGGKQMLVDSVRGELLKLNGDTTLASLQPVGLTEQQRQPIKFDAQLHCSALKQQGVSVAVELDLFDKSTIKLGHNTFAVQLRVGPVFAEP
jgi:hypothetical protein